MLRSLGILTLERVFGHDRTWNVFKSHGMAQFMRPGGTVQNPNICVQLALPVFFSVYRKCRGSLVDW